MEPQLLRTFQRQVRFQCEFALVSAAEVAHAHNAGELFFRLQNLLTAAGNISKAFWGSGGYMARDRKALRESVGLSDDCTLKSVAIRDNFEHFDERLEHWWKASPAHDCVDMNISGGGFAVTDVANIDVFRDYNPRTTELILWGAKFNISSILHEIEEILTRLRTEESKGNP